MFELILALLIGVLAGTFTGLIPGIHLNIVAVSVLSIAFVSNISTTVFLVFISAMAITHTFIDFIPATFLGAPDEDTGLSILPGHELLLKGDGHHAIRLTLLGSTIATISLIFLVPLFILLMPKIYLFLQRMMGFFLIWISIFLISQAKKTKTKAIIIFLLAGFLGLASMNLGLQQPLLPLLTGLFGTSTIIHSIKSKTLVPKQKIKKFKLNKKILIKPTIATVLVSPICSFFPGLGSSQAAIIGSEITGELDREQFLILVGSINTLVMSISFVTLFLFQKSRTGAASAISQLTKLTTTDITIILTTVLCATILAIPIALNASKIIAKHIHKIPYTKISFIVLVALIIIVAYFTGVVGLLALTVSTLLGLTCIEFEARRSFLMGAILIPTIIFYLPF
jgi:putative membrane protein